MKATIAPLVSLASFITLLVVLASMLVTITRADDPAGSESIQVRELSPDLLAVDPEDLLTRS